MGTKQQEWNKAKEAFFFEAALDGKKQVTIKGYEYTLNKFEAFLKPTTPLKATTHEIKAFLFSLQQKGYALATLFGIRRNLNVIYNFLVNEDYLTASPMVGVKRIKLPRSYPYVLTEEDVSLMLKAIKGRATEVKRNYAILLFLIDTGVRAGELSALNVDDVDFTYYTARVDGKTGERFVHFSKDTAKALSRYLKARGVIPHEDAFFTGYKGNRLTRSGLLQLVRKIGQEAGISSKRISPHTLRHTSATFWIKNGGDTFSLRRQLGHVDTRMAEVYVNLVGRDVAEAHVKYSPLKRIRK